MRKCVQVSGAGFTGGRKSPPLSPCTSAVWLAGWHPCVRGHVPLQAPISAPPPPPLPIPSAVGPRITVIDHRRASTHTCTLARAACAWLAALPITSGRVPCRACTHRKWVRATGYMQRKRPASWQQVCFLRVAIASAQHTRQARHTARHRAAFPHPLLNHCQNVLRLLGNALPILPQVDSLAGTGQLPQLPQRLPRIRQHSAATACCSSTRR